MDNAIKFDCGCIVKDGDISVENINLECRDTWETISKGLVYGVFQLESSLGKQWVKRLKPENMEHLGALGSILRPGSLKAYDKDGISITDHYCRRKNKDEEAIPIDKALEDVLSKTYQLAIYQENAMAIAAKIAGYNLEQCDILRKSIGKKNAALLSSLRSSFIEGCKKVGLVTEEKANEIFDMIEKSNRYSFNKSHAISYGFIGYICAWLKTHFPLEFYCGWLKHAKDKNKGAQEEIEMLVEEAKLLDIEVRPPSMKYLNYDFDIRDGKIYFGFGNIKGIGESNANKFAKLCQSIDLTKLSWFDFLINHSNKLNKTLFNNLTKVGVFDLCNWGLSRNQMLHEYYIWNELKANTEQKFIQEGGFSSLKEGLIAAFPLRKDGGATRTLKRSSSVKSLLDILTKPCYNNIDPSSWIINQEKMLLGVQLTENQQNSLEINTNCKELYKGITTSGIVSVEIRDLRVFKIKNGINIGKNMAAMSVADITCTLDNVLVFSELYETHQHYFYHGAKLLIKLERGYKRDAFIVKEVYEG
jgi:DNA polymerase III alpha subunit